MAFNPFRDFWNSWKRLPKTQRVALGCIGMVIGFYGPTLMSYIFDHKPQISNETTNKEMISDAKEIKETDQF